MRKIGLAAVCMSFAALLGTIENSRAGRLQKSPEQIVMPTESMSISYNEFDITITCYTSGKGWKDTVYYMQVVAMAPMTTNGSEDIKGLVPSSDDFFSFPVCYNGQWVDSPEWTVYIPHNSVLYQEAVECGGFWLDAQLWLWPQNEFSFKTEFSDIWIIVDP